MRLFESATLRLTGWYLAIIMLISLSFSVVIYQVSTNELQRGISSGGSQRLFISNMNGFEAFQRERLAESSGILWRNLFVANVFALLIGGGASYYFARKSLEPIEEAMEQQGRFASDASHELRTPLTAMKTELEVALRNPALSKGAMRELLHSNLEEVDKLKGLAERLLELSNGHDSVLAPTPIQDPILQATTRLQKQAAQKHIAISTHIQPFMIMADVDKLTDLLAIVIENAVKYSPEQSKITVKTMQHGKYAAIEVSDTGIGIKETDLPHIFDRFFRADISRSTQHVEGYGLGLSIARRLAELHQGDIVARSVIGKGSTFTITIPLVSSASSQ